MRWWNDSPQLSAAFGFNDLFSVSECNIALLYIDANYTCSKELFAGYLFSTVTSLLLRLRLRSVYISADTDQNKTAAYPADASDGRGFYWAAIREHLVKVAPKQMHLVSYQISFNRRTTFPGRKICTRAVRLQTLFTAQRIVPPSARRHDAVTAPARESALWASEVHSGIFASSLRQNADRLLR